MANVWMHNGFLQVEGRKMSKSEGNFVTIYELLHTETFAGRQWPGEVLRLAMLMTHYREPIDFSVKRLEEAERLLAKWPAAEPGNAKPDETVLNALADDLNTVAAVQALHEIDDLVLADFKVRILNGGTEAITRVLIESTDSSGVRWWTVGVSENIIDASFQALMDSVIYKLMKNRQLAGKIAAE